MCDGEDTIMISDTYDTWGYTLPPYYNILTIYLLTPVTINMWYLRPYYKVLATILLLSPLHIPYAYIH